ncbi:homoserine dehydrogenase [Parvularcula sp. LCG005]|uniref:homoserine dehydrogenase n=1 Tax=Parvularcula sp. LCG005 TaxID=3078805 RepID=UPI002942CD7F|nr:homoserine dehydrogenase [Parvularcula sp. LCG005]WOI54697.1 homoserine dehydrogenase [Parvularcula sp. LCG005]
MSSIKVSIAGLGTVGQGLLSLLVEDRRFTRQGIDFDIAGVSARNRSTKREPSIESYRWFDDPVELATDPETDIFVELIGGADGMAKAAVIAALEAGKPVVTANKALIAEHGPQLARLAEEKGVALKFEAAVAGGTPVVRGIRDGVAACTVKAVSGILNGTCNYILSTMAKDGRAFDDVLLEAQKLGYAEADPTFDVDGIDAAHKLVILACLAFDAAIPMSAVSCEGIRGITEGDVAAAKKLNMAIKLLAEAVLKDGKVALRVTPALVPEAHSFAKAMGSENVIIVDAEPLGRLGFNGPGAGAGATASAVAADLCDIARGSIGPVYAAKANLLGKLDYMSVDEIENPYFFRVLLKDEPGALAAVAEALAAQHISIESLRQPPSRKKGASVTIVTHPCRASAAKAVKQALAAHPFVEEAPSILPIVTP